MGLQKRRRCHLLVDRPWRVAGFGRDAAQRNTGNVLTREQVAPGLDEGLAHLAPGLASAGRENLILNGNMVFAGLEPENAVYQEAMAHAPTVGPRIRARFGRAALSPDRLGARIYESVDRREPSEDEACMLLHRPDTQG